MMYNHRRRRRHGRRSRHHGLGMWGARGRFFRPGELRLALLSLLGAGPHHGYELMKLLEERSGGMYRASAGSVYPTLQQLEDEGLARSAQENGKRVYQLTPEGEALVDEEADAIARIWRRAEEWGDWSGASGPEAWEIARPAMALAKSALRAVARAEGDAEVVDEIRAILDRARREVEAIEDQG
jgi:DNA-binding PadR family transcriptional regulator